MATQRKAAFTLTELLIVMTILAILAGLALSALSGASEQARAARTRSLVQRIDSIIADKWDGYRTRAVPIKNTGYANPRAFALARLNALRELQRMELPDRATDILDGNNQRACKAGIVPSSVMNGYFRKVKAATSNNPSAWTTTHEGAECLYLILSSYSDGDKNGLEFFSPSEIADTDNDGMREILDGWGTPIEFIRWPAGFTIQNNCVTMQTTVAAQNPDPFDPLKADTRASDADATNDPYAIWPLVFSAGQDGEYAINVGASVIYADTTPPNDPYYQASPLIGSPIGSSDWTDNITNHEPQSP